MINTKLLLNVIKMLCVLVLILITFNSCEPMYGATKHQTDCTQLEKEYKKLVKENKNLKTKMVLLKKLDTEKIKLLQKLQKENKELKTKKSK